MKKILFPILALILVACATSQVTTTSEVIASLPPPTATIIPTPTLNPQFVILQEQIANSGNRFALLPDGTIQETTSEGIKIIPGILVDNEGQIRLLVNGEEVVLSLADVTFDNIDGIKIEGYSYIEETGEWVMGLVIPEYLQNLEFVTKPESLNDLLRVDIADLYSGAFAEAVRQAYIAGKMSKFSENAPIYVPEAAIMSDSINGLGYGPALEPISIANYNASFLQSGGFLIVDSSGKELFLAIPKIIKTGPGVDDVDILNRSELWGVDIWSDENVASNMKWLISGATPPRLSSTNFAIRSVRKPCG